MTASQSAVDTETKPHGGKLDRGRIPRERVPRPLLALLGAVLALGVTWSLVTPAFQAPDENAHFGYVQSLAERFALPGAANRPVISTEQTLAAASSGADQAAAQLGTKMEWSSAAYERWRAQAREIGAAQRGDGGGPNPASINPPLYYLYETPAYLLAKGGDLFTRLQLMRLASVLWILVTVIGAWLLTGEVLGRDRTLQLVAAGAAGLAPMVQFLSATVTPDAMLFAFWTVALWLGVRVIKRGATARSALALFAVVGAACVVKATSFALLPAAVFAVAIGTWRSRPVYGKRWATIALSAAAGIVGTFGLWFVVAHLVHHAVFAQVSGVAAASGTDVREMLSYVWQFYLPRLPFMTDFPSVAPHIPVYDIWLKGAWANFGWLEVQFSNPVYVTLGLLTIGVTIAAAASLWRYRRTSDTAVGVFLLLVAATLIAGLHWQEYHLVKGGAPNGNQGRYLLPLIGLVGLAVAQALRPLQRRERMIGTAIALGGLFVLNVASLGLTLQRFYA